MHQCCWSPCQRNSHSVWHTEVSHVWKSLIHFKCCSTPKSTSFSLRSRGCIVVERTREIKKTWFSQHHCLFPDKSKIYVSDKELLPPLLPSPDKQTAGGRENDEPEAVTKAVLVSSLCQGNWSVLIQHAGCACSGTGMIHAVFHSDGTFPTCRLRLKTYPRGTANSAAQAFNIFSSLIRTESPQFSTNLIRSEGGRRGEWYFPM